MNLTFRSFHSISFSCFFSLPYTPIHFYFYSIVEHLITPELWMKNCRTRSPIPEQEPSPLTIFSSNVADDKVMKSLQPSHLPPSSSSMSSAKITSSVANLTHSTDNSRESSSTRKQPLINVLPSSKLLSRNLLHHKSLRKRRVSARLAMNTGSTTNGNKLNQNANAGISSERTMNNNFPPDMRSKIHTQMNNGSKAIQSPGFNSPLAPSPHQQFMQRPPVNLFKFRLPFPISSQHHRMPMLPQHLPHDDPNLNPLHAVTNPLLPPSVVLVPYPIPLPIIIPIPLPLSAFMRAYQTKGSSNNHNESRGTSTEPAQTNSSGISREEKDMRVNENEQPLDLSSEQGVCCDIDKEFLTQQLYHNNNDNNNDDDDDDDTLEEFDDDGDDNDIRREALSGNKKNDSLERIPKFEITRVENDNEQIQKQQQHHHVKEDSLCESNRPLRKRKIIATEEVSESQ